MILLIWAIFDWGLSPKLLLSFRSKTRQLISVVWHTFTAYYVSLLREGNGTPLQYSCLENPMDEGSWQAAVLGVTKSWARLSNFPFTFHFHALEKEIATHSSVLAWRIPGTVEPGGLPSMGSHRVGHNWSDLAAAAAAAVILLNIYWARTICYWYSRGWDLAQNGTYRIPAYTYSPLEEDVKQK